ncbi:MAG: RidA family protein [Acidaminococcaceae bacterium]|nr:RidA family protein [Acidaminococcaceae bacterium]
MKAVVTNLAPKAIGPYSQAILSGANLYLSGQIGINPETQNLVQTGIEAETEQIMNNIEAVLLEARYNFTHVVKTTIYVTDMQDFDAVNSVYGKYFKGEYPARSFVQVAALPKGAHVEIEVLAVK